MIRPLIKILPVLAFAAALSGCCCPRTSCCGDSPRFSVFSGAIARVAKQRGVSLEEAAQMLKDAGVGGFDSAYNDKNLAANAATAIKPINLYGFIDYRAADGGRKANSDFIDTAVRYGVPRVMCVPNDFTGGVESEAEYAKIRDGLVDLVAKGKAKGVTVTIEDYGGTRNACSYAKYLKRFLADVPGLCFALDSGNLYYAGRGEDILESFEYAKGRIAHLHLKDQTKENNRVYATLGLGAVPNREVVRRSVAIGYDAWYTLENPVGADTLDDVIRQIAVVRHWAAK